MKRILAALLVVTLPLVPAAAETPMSANEFEAYVTGEIFIFSKGGVPRGIEEYRPNRQVRWSFLDEHCKRGRWYPSGEQICFVYEDGTGPQCWTVFRASGSLQARFAGDSPGTRLWEIYASDEPMQCLGPEVGV